jgi:hypothetical protein
MAESQRPFAAVDRPGISDMVRTTPEKILFGTLCLNRPTVGRSMEARQHLQSLAFLTLFLLAPGAGFLSFGFILIVDEAVGSLIGSPAQAAGETLRGMLAAQIRMQGVACDKPLGAVRDAKRSKPDHAVWVLKCKQRDL